MLTGASGSSYVGFTPAIGALCIPAMNLEDGPAGVGRSNPSARFAGSTQQGAASSVMCSYSTVNGTHACQNPYLLSTVLRQQFGFGGFVTSDWYATHATAASANAGLDQDMPGTEGEFGSALQSAVSSGAVSTATLNSMVTPVLTEMFAFGLFDEPPAGSPAETATSSAHVADAQQLAEEGTVLLKNSGGVLPLSSSAKSIAVIGADASSSPLTAGGGSAGVTSSGTVTPLQGHHRRRAQRGDSQL